MNVYKVVRIFRDLDRRYTVKRNLSLDEAQTHCRNPESSSSTCTSKTGMARTEMYGPWLDAFEEQK